MDLDAFAERMAPAPRWLRVTHTAPGLVEIWASFDGMAWARKGEIRVGGDLRVLMPPQGDNAPLDWLNKEA